MFSQGRSSSTVSIIICGTENCVFFVFVFEVINSCGGKEYCFVMSWALSPFTSLVSFFFGRKLFLWGRMTELTEFIPLSTGIRGSTETISLQRGVIPTSPICRWRTFVVTAGNVPVQLTSSGVEPVNSLE